MAPINVLWQRLEEKLWLPGRRVGLDEQLAHRDVLHHLSQHLLQRESRAHYSDADEILCQTLAVNGRAVCHGDLHVVVRDEGQRVLHQQVHRPLRRKHKPVQVLVGWQGADDEEGEGVKG